MRLIVSLLVVLLVGCGGSHPRPTLYPVTGTLTVDGKPVPSISVDLMPIPGKAAGLPAGGITDKNGKFTLACDGQPGAPKGKYKLVLSQADPSWGPEKLTPDQLMELASKPPKKNENGEVIMPFPEEYLTVDTSPGEIEINDHEVTLDLKL